jgi:hypothetical protein
MKTIAIALAALLCVPAVASAETYSVGFDQIRHTGDGIQYDLAYSNFDASLGTLTSVRINLAGQYNISVYSPNPQTSGVAQFGPSILSAGNVILDNYGAHSGPANGSVASVSFSFHTDALLPNYYAQAPAGVTNFISISGSQRYLNDPGGADSDYSTLSNISGGISYNYTAANAVPEPASMALLALGVFGAAKVSRKRSTTA